MGKKQIQKQPETGKTIYKKMYIVQAIRNMRTVEKGKIQYQVKWLNYPESVNTWEPIQHLQLVKQLVKQFHIQQASKKIQQKQKQVQIKITQAQGWKKLIKKDKNQSINYRQMDTSFQSNKHTQKNCLETDKESSCFVDRTITQTNQKSNSPKLELKDTKDNEKDKTSTNQKQKILQRKIQDFFFKKIQIPITEKINKYNPKEQILITPNKLQSQKKSPQTIIQVNLEFRKQSQKSQNSFQINDDKYLINQIKQIKQRQTITNNIIILNSEDSIISNQYFNQYSHHNLIKQENLSFSDKLYSEKLVSHQQQSSIRLKQKIQYPKRENKRQKILRQKKLKQLQQQQLEQEQKNMRIQQQQQQIGDIQYNLKKLKSIDGTTIQLIQGHIYYVIKCSENHIYKLTRQQILQINPKWLKIYFESYI